MSVSVVARPRNQLKSLRLQLDIRLFVFYSKNVTHPPAKRWVSEQKPISAYHGKELLVPFFKTRYPTLHTDVENESQCR